MEPSCPLRPVILALLLATAGCGTTRHAAPIELPPQRRVSTLADPHWIAIGEAVPEPIRRAGMAGCDHDAARRAGRASCGPCAAGRARRRRIAARERGWSAGIALFAFALGAATGTPPSIQSGPR